MKKLMILAVTALTLAACAKTFVDEPVTESPIGFSTWNQTMTKAPKTAFTNGDEFDIYGFKWNTGPANQTTVFEGTDVAFDGTEWSYSPLRFFDGNFDNYTFFAAYPKNQLATAPAQTGLFVSNELTYDGANEKLLVAKKKDVAKANYGSTVALEFMHTGALLDIKFKKDAELENAVVNVTAFALSNIDTKGSYTVASYNGSNEPVGSWAVAAAPVKNASAAPYLNNSGVSLAAATGTTTGTAADLISNLIVMPQTLSTGVGAQTITLSYTITSGGETITFTDKSFEIRLFDDVDDTDNADTLISSWDPGVHYTYYITIAANAIQFTASITDWTTESGYHYLIN